MFEMRQQLKLQYRLVDSPASLPYIMDDADE
jgi:hypothetical protein